MLTTPTAIDDVVKKYSDIIQPSCHFKISKINVIKSKNGPFAVAKLLYNRQGCIFKDKAYDACNVEYASLVKDKVDKIVDKLLEVGQKLNYCRYAWQMLENMRWKNFRI